LFSRAALRELTAAATHGQALEDLATIWNYIQAMAGPITPACSLRPSARIVGVSRQPVPPGRASTRRYISRQRGGIPLGRPRDFPLDDPFQVENITAVQDNG
jgi:hypothetical protein